LILASKKYKDLPAKSRGTPGFKESTAVAVVMRVSSAKPRHARLPSFHGLATVGMDITPRRRVAPFLAEAALFLVGRL
jgi:hypothetical protein